MMKQWVRVAAISFALVAMSASSGCVADRPSRNGVFNENQYIRKDFLIRKGDESTPDPGWVMKATVVRTSTPNPLANLNLFVGAENGGSLVRFLATQDRLMMVNARELSANPEIEAQVTRDAEVLDSWSATNVDLKYRINLDGEKTNFYEENQELDWRVRQWLKLSFAKNDMSDVAPMGSFVRYAYNRCTDVAETTSTLVPGSFLVDEKNNYFEWEVSVTVPVRFDDEACVEAYGDPAFYFGRFGRTNVSFTMKYSFMRARTDEQARAEYAPLEIEEKDPIRRKYGTIDFFAMSRDDRTSLMTAKQYAMRFNPKKEMVWYFAPGFPEDYKKIFTDENGIVDQTNAVFEAAGAETRLKVKNHDEDLRDGERPRMPGDVRYSFIRFESDLDTGSPFIGVAQFVPDPRTGEILSSSIHLPNFDVRDRALQRLDFYLAEIGAQYVDPVTGEFDDAKNPLAQGACSEGDIIPFQSKELVETHNGRSTVFQKMQQYLQRPIERHGKEGPANWIQPQEKAFYETFYKLLPYLTFADPEANFFVAPEGNSGVFAPETHFRYLAKVAEFHRLARDIDKGLAPVDVTGPNAFADAVKFNKHMSQLTVDNYHYQYLKNFQHGLAQFDAFDPNADLLSYIDAFAKNGRRCVDGKWESRASYVDRFVKTYWNQVIWHEFGHVLGLAHNFMGSMDRHNFPLYDFKKADGTTEKRIGQYSSTVMEYNIAADRVFWANESGAPGWGPYDRGAIAFIYGNEKKVEGAKRNNDSYSGQSSKDAPWKDPMGFHEGGDERAFLYCDAQHMRYTPWCRQFDFGSSPSEIVANQIDAYEWQYQWRNYRLYRKFWDNSAYADTPALLVTDLRRMFVAWGFDFGGGDLVDRMRRLGIRPPADVPQAHFYEDMALRFNADFSQAGQMIGAFHQALIQQNSGERPLSTLSDNYFGDVTQQGIILDKLFAMQSFTGLWAATNYDPSQAAGTYIISYGSQFGDSAYQYLSEGIIESMVGGQYDVFAYFRPLAVANFAETTHSVNFGGRVEIRDWIGGKVFWRDRDFLEYFWNIAVRNGAHSCTSINNCAWDPRVRRYHDEDIHLSDFYNEFTGPDNKRYAWAYVNDRNAYVVVERDRNTASYKIVREYNKRFVRGEGDGNGDGYFGVQLQMKYFLDSFSYYN